MSGNREIPADVMERVASVVEAWFDEDYEIDEMLDTGSRAYEDLRDRFARALMAERPRWIPVSEKPKQGQMCMVVADGVVQMLALVWNGDSFEWADGWDGHESAFDPFPSEVATHWRPWPADPDLPPVPETETE